MNSDFYWDNGKLKYIRIKRCKEQDCKGNDKGCGCANIKAKWRFLSIKQFLKQFGYMPE